MSVIFGCGFARVAVKESFHKPGTTKNEADPVQRWKNYLEMLDGAARSTFAIDKTTFLKRARVIYELFRKMNSKRRNEYLKCFSTEEWTSLPQSQKSQHTLSNCRGCEVHHFAVQSLFPSTGKLKPQKVIQEALAASGNTVNSKTKPTQKAIKTAVKHIYSKINGPFENVFNISFAEAQTKVSELELQRKKSKIQKKANDDKGLVKKNKEFKKNGPNAIQRRCYPQGNPSVSVPNKGPLCTLKPQKQQPSGLVNGRERKILV